MIKVAFLIVFLATSTFLYAQVSDEYQPEVVFKKLKVKMRTQHFGPTTKSVIRSSFDESGRITQWELTDNETGNIPQALIKYYYNHRGLMIKAVEIFEADSIIKTFYYNGISKPDSAVSVSSGGVLTEKTIFYKDSTVEWKYWEDGTVFRKEKSILDIKGNSIGFSGFDATDSVTHYWNYKNIHEFDNTGRLVKTETRSDDHIISTDRYFYNKEGLLTEI